MPDSPKTNCTTNESALLKRLTILGFPTGRVVLQLE
jgi:hypothetical protein